jgi:phage-related protein
MKAEMALIPCLGNLKNSCSPLRPTGKRSSRFTKLPVLAIICLYEASLPNEANSLDWIFKKRFEKHATRSAEGLRSLFTRDPKGKDPGNAKPLKHLHEPISEIVVDERAGTFRAIYTVEFKDAIAVLHVFQKKSKSGIPTPKQEIDLALQRLKKAKIDYQEWKRHQ